MVFARSDSCRDCAPFRLRKANLPESFLPPSGLDTIREGGAVARRGPKLQTA